MRSQQTSLLQPFSVHGCSSFEILLLGLLFSELLTFLSNEKLYFPGKIELELFDQASSNKLYLLYPDYTVGIGISPIQLFLQNRSWTITTGREFHPAPEDEPYIILFTYSLYISIQKRNI